MSAEKQDNAETIWCALGHDHSNQAPILRELCRPLIPLTPASFADQKPQVGNFDAQNDNHPDDDQSEQIFTNTLIDAARRTADTWHSDVYEVSKHRVGRMRRTFSRQSRSVQVLWRQTFCQLETLYNICFEIGAETDVLVSSLPPQHPVLCGVLLDLHAKSCRIFREVITLLGHGCADGAYARWRSLHETAVTMLVLADHGDYGASIFLDHALVEQYRAHEEYAKHAEMLGVAPVSRREVEFATLAYEKLKARYSKPFFGQCGWAAILLKSTNDRLGFSEVEKAAQLSHQRPFYRMASHFVHSNPKSVEFSLTAPSNVNKLRLTGSSPHGLCDPAHAAAISLSQSTSVLGVVLGAFDSLALQFLVQLVVNDIGRTALDAHNRVNKLPIR